MYFFFPILLSDHFLYCFKLRVKINIWTEFIYHIFYGSEQLKYLCYFSHLRIIYPFTLI